jgi:hypothetical protein
MRVGVPNQAAAGETRVALTPRGGGVFAGRGVVVRCTSGRRDWRAAVVLARPAAPPLSASFLLTIAE